VGLIAGAVLVVSAGCGTDQRVTNTPAPATYRGTPDRAALPPPDPAKIVFEPKSGTLRFPTLAQGKWMVQLPGEKSGKPVGAELNLPPEVDPDRTLVYYSHPGGKHSSPVSLKQIRDSREEPVNHTP
jgi:hypothetical protein